MWGMDSSELSADIAKTIYETADQLFFLGNKSQKQIADEYKLLSVKVSRLTQRISHLFERM